MKNRLTTVSALFLLASALVWLTAGCGGVQNGKIPITTSSSEALEYYVQGRDLAEKLQAQESIQYFEKAVAADPAFAETKQRLSKLLEQWVEETGDSVPKDLSRDSFHRETGDRIASKEADYRGTTPESPGIADPGIPSVTS